MIYTKSEIEAARLVTAAKGTLTTNDSIKADANYIIMLGKRIEMERLEAAAEKDTK